MRPARAIIGTALGGWLALGLVFGGSVPAVAQQAAGAGPGPAAGISGPPGPGGADVPGTMSRHSLIESLDTALRNALSGRAATETAPEPAGAMPLAARDAPAPGRGPIVVELFTSQGCASCPAADEMFVRFAQRPDVIALSLHVDYWDYLGWEDPFAQPAFTARQKAYARAAGSKSIFTPQILVEGSGSIVGGDEPALDALVAQQQARPTPVSMTVAGSKGQYVLELRADPPLPQGAVVQIVRYMPQARVEILRGENAGLVVDYANVVTAWHAVAEWDGRTPTRLNARIDGDEPAVVIVQTALPGKSAPLPGPIVAAARLD
ncbi:DUF1223 domain-containing protein [Paenirhodobacter sp.]|uniref:DUF1223 domain-containing protein n=1 Tax=Paenirhodobacter sp. TaxID=1965326 RepID=UPI003B504288